MTIEKHWQGFDATTQKYGVDKSSLLTWIEEGIIRSEVDKEGILRINIDDLELKIHELTRI